MKMTPEQKAFFEFGAARAFLFNKIEEARNYARRVYGESYCELTPKERADCWKHSEIKFFIKLVRERRAACRAADAVGTNPGGNLHNSLMSATSQVGGTVADNAGGNPGGNLYNSLENNEDSLAETMADGKEGE